MNPDYYKKYPILAQALYEPSPMQVYCVKAKTSYDKTTVLQNVVLFWIEYTGLLLTLGGVVALAITTAIGTSIGILVSVLVLAVGLYAEYLERTSKKLINLAYCAKNLDRELCEAVVDLLESNVPRETWWRLERVSKELRSNGELARASGAQTLEERARAEIASHELWKAQNPRN